MLTLARLDEVEVEVQIDQQYIDQVSAGREVSLRISGSGVSAGDRAVDGVREWTGQVAAVVPRSNWEKGSRSFPVIIRVRNEIDLSTSPPTPALREGMMAEAAFRGVSVKALLVPKDSVVRTSRFCVCGESGGGGQAAECSAGDGDAGSGDGVADSGSGRVTGCWSAGGDGGCGATASVSDGDSDGGGFR